MCRIPLIPIMKITVSKKEKTRATERERGLKCLPQ